MMDNPYLGLEKPVLDNILRACNDDLQYLERRRAMIDQQEATLLAQRGRVLEALGDYTLRLVE